MIYRIQEKKYLPELSNRFFLTTLADVKNLKVFKIALVNKFISERIQNVMKKIIALFLATIVMTTSFAVNVPSSFTSTTYSRCSDLKPMPEPYD